MKNNKIPVYSVIGSNHDIDWIKNSVKVDKIQDAKIVVFPGGADVNPELYGFNEIYGTYTSSYADKRDLEAFSKMNPDQLAVGICRGAQLLTVLNHGKLIQNVSNHAIGTTHPIYENIHHGDQKALETTSLHHQMMYPFCICPDFYRVLYYATRRSRFYEGSNANKENENPLNYSMFSDYGEPEVVMYKTPGLPKCLAIQGHPEMMDYESAMVNEMNDLINKILKEELNFDKYFKINLV